MDTSALYHLSPTCLIFRWSPSASEVEQGNQRDSPQVALSNLEPLSVVFQEPRGKSDCLLLWNGDRLAGTFLAEEIDLITGYARLPLPVPMLAGIQLDQGARGIEFVQAINGNRFSGFLQDSTFAFRSPSGEQLEVRRDKINKIIFSRYFWKI